MASYRNREELLDLLLEDVQEVIEQVIQEENISKIKGKLLKLSNHIDNYKKLNPKISE